MGPNTLLHNIKLPVYNRILKHELFQQNWQILHSQCLLDTPDIFCIWFVWKVEVIGGSDRTVPFAFFERLFNVSSGNCPFYLNIKQNTPIQIIINGNDASGHRGISHDNVEHLWWRCNDRLEQVWSVKKGYDMKLLTTSLVQQRWPWDQNGWFKPARSNSLWPVTSTPLNRHPSTQKNYVGNITRVGYGSSEIRWYFAFIIVTLISCIKY